MLCACGYELLFNCRKGYLYTALRQDQTSPRWQNTHSHTCTQNYTHSLAHSHACTHTHITLTPSLTHTHTTYIHTHTHTLTHSLSHTHTLHHHHRRRRQTLGFVGAKIPCAYGPSDGDIGLAKNVEIFRQARESVGPDFPLMWVCTEWWYIKHTA